MVLVKKTTRRKEISKTFYLTIFDLIQQGFRPSRINKDGKEEGSITSILKTTKQRINPYLSLLKKSGYIRTISKGVWETTKNQLTEKDLEIIFLVKKTTQASKADTLQLSKKLKKNMSRGHAFRFVLSIPKTIRNWDEREKIFGKLGLNPYRLNNLGGGCGIIFEGRKIHFKNKTITIFETDSFFSEFAQGSNRLAIYNFIETVKSLERKLGANFMTQSQYKYKIVVSEYALIKNELARQYNKEGKKLKIYNSAGAWLLIDNSDFGDIKNLEEFEILQNKEGDEKAVQRAGGLANFWNDQDKTNFEVTPSFVLNGFDKQNQAILQNSQNLENYATHLSSHVKSVQDLGAGVTKNSQIMEKMLEVLNDFKKQNEK